MTKQYPRDTCYFCGGEGPLESHHILPQRYGGSDTDDNLVDVCRNCHQKLENVYGDQFWDQIEISKADHSPDYRTLDDDDVSRWEPIIGPDHDPDEVRPYDCPRCQRHGPFNERTQQPTGRRMFVCCRCDHAMVLVGTTTATSISEIIAGLENETAGAKERLVVRAAEQILDMNGSEVEHKLAHLTSRGEVYEARTDQYRVVPGDTSDD